MSNKKVNWDWSHSKTILKAPAQSARMSFIDRHWVKPAYSNDQRVYLIFNLPLIEQASEGDHAIFFSIFHPQMKENDKKAFARWVTHEAYLGKYDLFPLLDTLQRCDEYFFGLIKSLMITDMPDLPQFLPPVPTHPTPFAGTRTPPMGTIVPPPLTGNRFTTTSPGMQIPLEESALDESDPNIPPVKP